MTVSFQEFRDRFPDANILSDLLMVEEHRFIVRVTIQTRDSGTVMGLSADTNLEVAEDQARQRALQALGFVSRQSSDSSSQITHAVEPRQPYTDSARPAEPAYIEPEPPAVVETVQTGDTTDGAIGVVAPAVPTVAHPPQGVTRAAADVPKKPRPVTKSGSQPPTSQVTDDSQNTSPEQGSDANSINDEPLYPHSIEIASETEVASETISAASLPAPINLSDVIAQTDIELRRLGWTVETGREYLEQTYNKRSRHELSEEELIQFLCYLEGLPEPQTTS